MGFEPVVALIGLLCCLIHFPKRIYNFYRAMGTFPSMKELLKMLGLHLSLNAIPLIAFGALLVASVGVLAFLILNPVSMVATTIIGCSVSLLGIIATFVAVFGKALSRKLLSKLRDDPPPSLAPTDVPEVCKNNIHFPNRRRSF